jgi:hypothetical protein
MKGEEVRPLTATILPRTLIVEARRASERQLEEREALFWSRENKACF